MKQVFALDMRVLVLAPTRADAEVTLRVLNEAHVSARLCSEGDLAREIEEGAGAVILTDDAAHNGSFEQLRRVLERQPSWSELPILVLARAESSRLESLRTLPGVVLLERPVHVQPMVSAVQAALRARLRQYELRNQLQQTKAMNEELQHAARAKDEFLATLSHELRNPLSALTSAASLLDRPGLPPSTDQAARAVVKRQAALMGRLLDDLLDVARITRGRLEIKKVPADLASIVRAAVETVQPLMTRKRHQFELKLPERDVLLEADPVRLAQVLANLLTNAAKYTESGGHISLEVERQDDIVRFRVRDSGIGIPPEAMADIFKMFAQLRPAIERSEGGLGIGLALTKALVELHGGTIAAESGGPGAGTTFTVTIPSAPVAPEVVAVDFRDKKGSESAARCDILLAEDNPDALETLATLLQLEGHTVRTARDGVQALKLLDERMPDVMLLDIGMPVMNGYEVARRVRQHHAESPVMLIALTGWGQPADRAHAHDAGFDHHLTKPVEFAELAKLLAHACEVATKRSQKPQLKVVGS